MKNNTIEDNGDTLIYGDPKSLFNNLIWMNSTEASTYLRVSTGSLRNMVSQGQIRSYKLGKRLRFKKSELDKAMELSLKGDFPC